MGTTATCEVRNPNGTVTDSWSQTFDNIFFSSYWYWTIETSDVEGVWEFSATYNGQTVTREFSVGENLSVSETNPAGLKVFLNPVNDALNFKTFTPISNIIIRDVTGREMFSQLTTELNSILDFSKMSSGVFFVTGVSTQTGEQSTIQIIKQ